MLEEEVVVHSNLLLQVDLVVLAVVGLELRVLLLELRGLPIQEGELVALAVRPHTQTVQQAAPALSS